MVTFKTLTNHQNSTDVGFLHDRSEYGGVVFIATDESLVATDEPEFGGIYEIIWASIQFSNSLETGQVPAFWRYG